MFSMSNLKQYGLLKKSKMVVPVENKIIETKRNPSFILFPLRSLSMKRRYLYIW